MLPQNSRTPHIQPPNPHISGPNLGWITIWNDKPTYCENGNLNTTNLIKLMNFVHSEVKASFLGYFSKKVTCVRETNIKFIAIQNKII